LSIKKIYLIRHGETDYNRRGIVQGCGVDSSLNELGRVQANAFFRAYQHVPFDAVYTSKLKRSIESVQSFIDKGIPHRAFAGLNEISWGYKEGQPITPEEDAYYHSMLKNWQEGKTALRIEGGESPEDVAGRQREVIDYIIGREREQNVLICMHGRAIRILLCQLLNYPLQSMDVFEHENLGLYLLNYTGSMFHIAHYNDTRHLLHLQPEPVSA
jgi:probable phosphoglycerate mutase